MSHLSLTHRVLRDRSGNMLRQSLAASELPESAYRNQILNVSKQVASVITLTRRLLKMPAIDPSDRLGLQAKVAKTHEAVQRLVAT